MAVADVNGARIHEHAVAQALEEEITVSYPRRSNDSIACGYSGSSDRKVREVGRARCRNDVRG